MYDLDNLFIPRLDEIIFVKIKNGRYKLILSFSDMGVVEIPQDRICSSMNLLYDAFSDSIIISNIRNRNPIVKLITDKKVRVVVI